MKQQTADEEGEPLAAWEIAREQAAAVAKLETWYDGIVLELLAGASEVKEQAQEQVEEQMTRCPAQLEIETATDESQQIMAKFVVLATATVRAGPDSSSKKVGEHKQGTLIEVVREHDRLDVVQTITEPGGWVKLKTSKGRELLERKEDELDAWELPAADPNEPPRDLVAQKRFLASHDKKKVKITVDGAGIYVTEDNKGQKVVVVARTSKIARFGHPKHKPRVILALFPEF